MSTSEKLKYPYTWGRGIINQFVEKYARGTYILAKVLDRSPGEIRHGLIMLLCTDRTIRFEAIKRVIKCMEDYTSDDLKRLSSEDKKVLYKYLVLMGEDSALYSKQGINAIDNWQNHRLIL